MPMGSVTCRSLKDSPVTAFTLDRKKSAYLQYASSARLSATEAVKKSFDRFLFCACFSIRRPKT